MPDALSRKAGDDVGAAAARAHRIVVVGGGAAGLELVTRLGDKLGKRGLAEIILVERSRTHLWKPLLHAVAAGSMDPSEHQLNYLAQAHWHHFRYQYGEMIGLDRAGKRVHLAATFDEEGRQITTARDIAYDTLVIAIGSVTNDFGTPGAAEHAVPLETPEQAVRFHHRLVNACLRAQAQEGPVRPGQLHVAIIGAGATGTELAAELYQTARDVVAYGLDHVDPDKDIRIILVESASRILPALPERISEATLRLLQKLGVEVRTGAPVAEVRADGIRLASGEIIPSELVIWAAGVKGPDVLRDLDGLEVNRVNQLTVTPTLQTTRDTDIFAIGDCAACPRQGFEQPVPPRAQAAHQEAAHLLRQLRRRLEGKPLEPFAYRDFGSLVSFGRLGAIGNLMGLFLGKNLFIEGALARLMYRSLYKMHEVALHGAVKTAMGALARGLSRRRGEPKVKLH
ncbi:NADH dehydrogenase [Rhizobiales bacterium GAS191]|jgi:NADH dehydrogenase|nr:NADH dehydrogenase [Rhizobiales bacterium GAS113]SEC46906.1 NADH dehydrogenase [Rhizobiales bacterium GAS191]SEC79389.1 NADH dehydrogenase [Rhizobiales bacterium GAS188]